MAVKRETELYPPIKAFFQARGYEVKGEVRDCDLVAFRADETVPTIVEMKKTFTLPLLLQGVDRQRTGACVWLAVERNRTKKGAHNQRFSDIAGLCRRLQLGFLTVTFYKTKAPVVEVWCEPPSVARHAANALAAEAAASYAAAAASPRPRAGAAKILKEFAARSGDYNVGGSSKRKLVTAYRENALRCALALFVHGASAPRLVKERTSCPNAQALLRGNVYGWFRRISKGVYELTPAGALALTEYRDVVDAWSDRYEWAADWSLKPIAEGEEG